jgi:hypothetical protein
MYVELLQQLFVLSLDALPMTILQALVVKTASAELRWKMENTRTARTRHAVSLQ